MNIAVAVNDEYIRPLTVMLASLFRHEKGMVDVYLIYSSVSKRNLDLLDSCVSEAGCRFTAIPVDDEIFQDAPLPRYFSKEIYYRTLCAVLLPETLERVLYLDCDIMIRGSIRSFYETDFQGNTLIGVTDIILEQYFNDEYQLHKAELGLSDRDVYINSGVLLIDLVKMRKKFNLKDLLHQIEEKKEVLKFPDQDILNILFRGDIQLAEEIYNYPTLLNASVFLRWIMGAWMTEHPLVVHYQGFSKPWHTDYTGKYYFEYQKYYRKTQSRRERIIFAGQHLKGYFQRMVKDFYGMLSGSRR